MKHIYTTILFLALITFTLPTTASAEGIFGPGNCFLGLMECESGETLIEITTPDVDPDAVPPFENRVDGPTTEVSRTGVDREDGLASYIIRVIIFINLTLVPLLFGIALLFFLFNIVRYFILSPDSFDARDKARRAALYGIAAFVFLVSIWGIVNLFVSGLEFDREDPICPDYLGTWCKNGTGGNVTVTPPALVDFGAGSGEPVVIIDGNSEYSGLAELLYGSAMDGTEVSFNPGNPRNQGNTPQIASNASCTAGINTLQQAANVESNQAVYAFYTTAAGATAWTNLTDGNRNGRLVIDGDIINQIELDGATNIRIIQMQPKAIATTVALPLRGYGPSTADYSLQCDNLLRDFPFITVDWNGVWKSENEGQLACPRRTADTDDLGLIDALYAVSMLPQTQRNSEFEKLLNSSLTPNDKRSDLQGFSLGNLNTFTGAQIRNLADGIENDVRLISNRVSASAACQIADSPVTTPPVSPQTSEEIVRDAVATTLGEDPAAISIVNVRAVTWTNGCLGLEEPGDICTMATVPGFEIVLNIGGEQRVFHTNSDGSIFREDRS